MYKRQEQILILSGPESIDIAIEYSVNMCRVIAETKARSNLFSKALDMPVSYTHLDVYKRQI